MQNCQQELKKLISQIVLPDIEDHLDELFAKVAKDKKQDINYQNEIDEIQEMRSEFKEILEEINSGEISQEECEEIYEEIKSMIIQDD